MADRITKPGIYHDFPEAAYFADPCPEPSLTQSIAKVLIEYSPAHARLEHPRLAPPAEDDAEAEKYDSAKAIGNAAHKLILGRGREIAEIAFDAFRSDKAKAARAEAEKAGRMPILSKHLRRAEDMVGAARLQLGAAGFSDAFVDGHSEAMLAWREGPLWLRSLVDWHADLTAIWDYKSSGMSCAPHVVADCAADRGWDIQAAMHERGLDVLDPDNAGRRSHFYVAQENFAPYALTVVRIGEADLTMGRKKLNRAIDDWARCIKSGRWPLYQPEVMDSHPKGYQEARWLERETQHEERRTLPKAKFDGENLLAG